MTTLKTSQMKKESFIKKILSMDYPQALEKGYTGHCPCAHFEGIVEGKKIGFRSRCWRVSDRAQDLYVWGEHPKKFIKEVAEALKKKLDEQEWYNPYTIIYEKYD